MKKTALIFNDHEHFAWHLFNKIESTGLFGRVLECRSNSEVIERLRQYAVDAIYCNLSMPEAPTWTRLVSHLEKKEDWNDIPLFVFSEEYGPEGRIHAMEHGATDCFSLASPPKEIAARTKICLRYKERADDLRREKAHLTQLALTDGLTGLYNRTYFDASLDSELARSRRSGRPVSLLLVDLDRFKSLNDTHGHPFGDKILKLVSESLRKSVRRSDIVCRYGGEEFAIILPETPIPGAYRLAEKIRKNIFEISKEHFDGEIPVSASVGLSCALGDEPMQKEKLIKRSDCALYTSKRNGRNRTEIYIQEELELAPSTSPIFAENCVGYA